MKNNECKNTSSYFFSRREFLSRAGMGMASLGLGALNSDNLLGASLNNPLRPKLPHFQPKAKRIIHIFFNGGLSHVDSFDPKPELTKYHGKKLKSPNLVTERPTGTGFGTPFEFKNYGQSGIPISEIFEPLGEHADDLCIIRSMHADVPNHEPSLMLLNCGDNTLSRPSMGSWLTYGLGSENENLPGFIAMCPGGHPVKGPDNWRSSFLPGIYEGTYVDTSHYEDVTKLIQNIKNPVRNRDQQKRQLSFLQSLNNSHLNKVGHDPALEARIMSYEQAFKMQMEASEAFDISKEPQYIQKRYGNTVQSKQLLISRRLAERGVRFIQAWHGKWQPWDNHDEIEKNHRKLAGECAQGIAALITDLKERGLFEDTLIMMGGEFGRTPTIEQTNKGDDKQGRDHNHHGFSFILAGGGIKGGMTYGTTDEFGFQAADNPVHIHDLQATVLHLMGIDHENLTYRYASRDFRLTDVHGTIVKNIFG